MPYGTGLVTLSAGGVAMFSADARRPGGLFRSLTIFITGTALSAFVDGTLTGAAADTGVIVSAAAAANQHGLPTNFGPGRDNWVFADTYRLTTDVEVFFPAVVAAGDGGPFVAAKAALVGPNARDITVVVKNTSPNAISYMMIRMRYDHSIVL